MYSYMSKVQNHYVEGKKQNAKDFMLYNFIYMKSSKGKTNLLLEIKTVVFYEAWD